MVYSILLEAFFFETISSSVPGISYQMKASKQSKNDGLQLYAVKNSSCKKFSVWVSSYLREIYMLELYKLDKCFVL